MAALAGVPGAEERHSKGAEAGQRVAWEVGAGEAPSRVHAQVVLAEVQAVLAVLAGVQEALLGGVVPAARA